jgi:hypothetical protein
VRVSSIGAEPAALELPVDRFGVAGAYAAAVDVTERAAQR